MATTVHSQQLWQPRPQNQAGIRRLKLADAALCQIVPGGMPGSALHDALGLPAGNLVTLADTLIWYEFVFPTDQACGMQVQMQATPSGAVYYTQTLSFQLPQLSQVVTEWAHHTRQTRWVALAEDWNGAAYLLGHPDRGLVRSLAATTGASARDRNQQAFTLTAEQLVPYYCPEAYEDDIMFPLAGTITGLTTDLIHGFSTDLIIFNTMSLYKYQVINILQVRRGDTFEVNLTLANNLDPTGGTIRAQVRKYADDPVVALELDTEIDGQILMLSKEASAVTLPGGLYVYDVELLDAENKTHTLFGGKFEVLSDVTR